MMKSRNGLKEGIYVNSGDKIDEKVMEMVRRNIEKYREFLVEIGKL